VSAAELSKFPLLSALGDLERDVVADSIEVEEVAAGTLLFREGDPANGALFIAEGRIRVHSADLAGEAEVGAGDTLGTLSIVDVGPRLATAETLSRTRLYRLRRSAFSNLMASEPGIACRLLEGIVRESAAALREEMRGAPAKLDPTRASD